MHYLPGNELLSPATQGVPVPRPSTPSPWLRCEWLGMGGAAALLLALTLPFLGQQGFWFDEIFSVETAQRWSGMMEVFSRYENNMALYYVMLWLWMFLGDSEFFVRLLSLLFALCTIPVVHAIARRLFDARTAIIADFVLISSIFFVQYAGEARSYSLLALLTAWSSLLLLQALERPTWLRWACYAVVAVAGVYAHYFALLTIAAHAVALMLRGHPGIPKAKAISAVAVMIALMAPLVLFRPANLGQVDHLNRPDLGELYMMSLIFGSGKGQLLIAAICLTVLFVAVLRAAPQRGDAGGGFSRRWSVGFLLALVLVPMLIAVSFSLLVKPMLIPKYLIGCLPAYVILIAAGAAQLRVRWATTVVVCMFGFLVINGLRHGFSSGGQWRDVASSLVARAQPADAVICYPFFALKPINHYLDRLPAGAQRVTVRSIATGPYHPGGGARDPDPDMAEIRQLARDHDCVWIVVAMMFPEKLNRHWLPRIVDQMKETHPFYEDTKFLRGGGALQLLRFSRSAPPESRGSVSSTNGAPGDGHAARTIEDVAPSAPPGVAPAR